MSDRLLLTVAFVTFGAVLFVAARSTHLSILRRRLGHAGSSAAPGLAAFQPGQPALLYFTSPNCVPCRTIVRPALQRLTTEIGDRFQVLEINAENELETASYWKVLSVPTIFVLDPQGKPQHVHYGVVTPDVLRTQLSAWPNANE